DGSPISPVRLPYGCNYAVRSVLQKKRPYDSSLGRGPVTWLRGGEETEMLGALFAEGATGRWLTGAAVQHVIAAERQTMAYLWRYYEGCGMTEARSTRSDRPFRSIPRFIDMCTAD